MRYGLKVCVIALIACARTTNAQSAESPEGEKSLARRVTLRASHTPLGDVFVTLRRESKVPLAWSGDIVPAGREVTVVLRNVPVRAVLDAVLVGTGLGYVTTDLGTIIIVPRSPQTAAPAPAAVHTEMSRGLRATGVQQLDAVVVMGNVVDKRPERDQPTAIAVVDRARLAASPGTTLADAMRTMLPGVMLWDHGPGGRPAPIAGVRGVSSFSTRALKTYVDGIELASPELFTLIDARSIERMEIIRGPQGAALYGPDALNGIVQIETRRGRPGHDSLAWRGEANAGRLARPDLARDEPVRDYAAGLTGAKDMRSVDVSAVAGRIGRSGETPLADTWGVSGGGRAVFSSATLDLSGRVAHRTYADEHVAVFGGFTNPVARVPRDADERAVALTLVHATTDGWHQTLVAGYHHISGTREPLHSPLLAPSLPFGASDENATRTSVRYASAIDVSDRIALSGGAEYSRRAVERGTRVFQNLLPLYHDDLRSTGAFAQARIRAMSHVTLSGGARAEHLSSVAPGVGLLWASTAGASWTHALRPFTVRLRTAWGSGIRPPEPGMNVALARGEFQQEANADLVPERQRGIETGADMYFARGAYVRLTWYEQRAVDLIQQVRLRPADTTMLAYQFQNIGAVRNHGLEAEAHAAWRFVSGDVVVNVPRSELVNRARAYSGELRPGDRLLETPDESGAASIRVTRGRSSAELGVSWLGSWIGYDWVLIAKVDQRQAPRRAGERDYWMRYPSVTRPFMSLSLVLPHQLRLTARADNPGGGSHVIRDNLSPPLGSVLTIGLARSE